MINKWTRSKDVKSRWTTHKTDQVLSVTQANWQHEKHGSAKKKKPRKS